MTSCPVGNKTSLSRKPCIADKKLLWITIMKSLSLINLYTKRANINLKNLNVYSQILFTLGYNFKTVVHFLDEGKFWYHFLALFNIEGTCP